MGLSRITSVPIAIAALLSCLTSARAETRALSPATKTQLDRLASLRPQLSAGAQCRVAALKTSLRTQLRTLPPNATPQALIANIGISPTDGDVSQLAFVVLMEATQDQDNDLEQVMADTKAQDQAKGNLRALKSKLDAEIAANSARLQAIFASAPAVPHAAMTSGEFDGMLPIEDVSLKLPQGSCPPPASVRIHS